MIFHLMNKLNKGGLDRIMRVDDFSVDKILDPTGFIEGDRFEFHLYLMLDEEDELYNENGIGVRAIVAVQDGVSRIAMAHFFERPTEKPMDFALEDEELAFILAFCDENMPS